LQLLRQLVFL